ncbi:Gfo/Idh/MocA family protein [Microbacterium allomyrinae]|uniref:Gfo/Idh/MocA family oxidoreductase n=1 Tax=Microbacterium allomyrinae TaxID=2830666 RepID=A0A9X1LVS4_9MICO|nr:Gfo/Idh/MocA family oxidoreductase [Microbacterium allomyrinae]MCC2032701.1 Gfo/Idh/MocA family oxidoreductase [Microbacterium allomyrinae]
MALTRWAVLGPGAISRDFVTGLRASSQGVLHAVGSSSPERAAAFAAEHGAAMSGSYDEVLARDDVDAVYIGTVHTTHADLAIRALEAGKAVLCEKPASPDAADVERILAVAEREGRVFVEAFKNRFGPFAEALRSVLADGALGAPERVEASFGFAAGAHDGRLFDPALAGGAILDVGCYPLSLAVDVAVAGAEPRPGAIALRTASGTLVDGVDGHATGEFDVGGLVAALETSIVRDLPRSALIRCTDGMIELPDAWGDRAASATTLTLHESGGRRVIEVPSIQPMAAEADAVSLALAEGRLEAPEMPWADTRLIAAGLTAWRAAVLG